MRRTVDTSSYEVGCINCFSFAEGRADLHDYSRRWEGWWQRTVNGEPMAAAAARARFVQCIDNNFFHRECATPRVGETVLLELAAEREVLW